MKRRNKVRSDIFKILKDTEPDKLPIFVAKDLHKIPQEGNEGSPEKVISPLPALEIIKSTQSDVRINEPVLAQRRRGLVDASIRAALQSYSYRDAVIVPEENA
ncbi:unnamed protein product [Leptidea sinapis]|uniref:Uncharacterized protein n=1 Tax=Leptidea sinapis TaxID=189913 RepID=A0A5E4QE13_9NEOP|nr:unnamed protein product [Leptidea sinapis]